MTTWRRLGRWRESTAFPQFLKNLPNRFQTSFTSDRQQNEYIKWQTIKYCLIGFLVPAILTGIIVLGYTVSTTFFLSIYGLKLTAKFATAIFFLVFLISWAIQIRKISQGLQSNVGPGPSKMTQWVDYSAHSQLHLILNKFSDFSSTGKSVIWFALWFLRFSAPFWRLFLMQFWVTTWWLLFWRVFAKRTDCGWSSLWCSIRILWF